jgi:hypothetical protein
MNKRFLRLSKEVMEENEEKYVIMGKSP